MAFFTGGVHPSYNKLTANKEIKAAKIPKKVILPLSQHTGAVCEPLVNVGDEVKIGQKIAESKAYVSAPIHASISGRVIDISEQLSPLGNKVKSITIISGRKIEWHGLVKPRENTEALTKEQIIDMSEIATRNLPASARSKMAISEHAQEHAPHLSAGSVLDIIKEAGIVGLGGAMFPTHVKLNVKDKKIDTVILNGAECEPYLTCDHRLMLEQPDKIINGLKLIMKAVGAEKAYIGIEDNKKDAVELLTKKLKNEKNIEVKELKTIYPHGAEKMLICSITQRKVPPRKLPLDVGVVVSNVQTAKAVYDAVYEGKPLIERIVTVTGDVKNPQDMLVKIGTPFKDLIEECGGYAKEPFKLIAGGPLMGIAQPNADVPVIKGTSGILALSKIEIEKEKPCIKCAACVDVCPVILMPNIIAEYSKHERYDDADKVFALDCFECGCCSFVCPSKIPLVERIKKAKAEIIKKLKEKG